MRYKVVNLATGYKILDRYKEGRIITIGGLLHRGSLIKLSYNNQSIDDVCRTLNLEEKEFQEYTKTVLEYCNLSPRLSV